MGDLSDFMRERLDQWKKNQTMKKEDRKELPKMPSAIVRRGDYGDDFIDLMSKDNHAYSEEKRNNPIYYQR